MVLACGGSWRYFSQSESLLADPNRLGDGCLRSDVDGAQITRTLQGVVYGRPVTVDEARRSAPAVGLVSKVPQVTALFWIIKVLTTGMGETTSDFLAHALDPVVAVGLVGIVFA